MAILQGPGGISLGGRCMHCYTITLSIYTRGSVIQHSHTNAGHRCCFLRYLPTDSLWIWTKEWAPSSLPGTGWRRTTHITPNRRQGSHFPLSDCLLCLHSNLTSVQFCKVTAKESLCFDPIMRSIERQDQATSKMGAGHSKKRNNLIARARKRSRNHFT